MIAQEGEITQASYAELIRQQLNMLGHDVASDGLAETPQRVARFHLEHFNNSPDPIEDAARHLKAFEAPTHGGLVAVTCSFSAFCEHHLLPFFGTAQVVYQPREHVTGLSKVSRVVNEICNRPQIQERITAETAQVMMRLKPVGVLVDLVGEHTCMKVRGVCDPCSSTRTRVFMGEFERDADKRGQALAMLD